MTSTTRSAAVLAGPPGEHCFTGVKHSGTPVGRSVTIAGVPTYVSEPPPSSSPRKEGSAQRRVLLFFADVWGPFFLNNQLLQDYFAEHGYVVLGVDYFFGDPVHVHTEAGFDRQAWMDKAKKTAVAAVPRWLDAVFRQYGPNAKYCAVGYCFGGPFALDMATTEKVVAAAFAHPAFLSEDQITRVKRPVMMSCAEIDHTFPLEKRRRAEDLLIEAKAKYHIQVFSGVAHGFAVRGDPAVQIERWAKEESARGILNWFDEFSLTEKTAVSSYL